MKKIFVLTVISLFLETVTAQYCGSSGPSQCTASGTVLIPGLSPIADSLTPLINGVNSTTVIEFKNFDTVFFGGNAFKLQSLRIDTIDNLPQGLCWASDRANNTYSNSESGCIKVNGVPCDSTGQYKIRIIASATIPPGITIQVNAASVGLHYYVRLNNPGDPVTPIDSVLTPFIPYGGLCLNPPLTLNVGADQSVCSGTLVTLSPTINGGQAPFIYSWQSIGNTVSCDSCLDTDVTLTQSSTFVLTVTDSLNNSVTDSITYTANEVPVVTVTPTGPIEICPGNSTVLQSTATLPVTYLWQLNGNNLNTATNAYYTAAIGGSYRVVVKTAGNCVDTSNTVVVTTIVCTGIDEEAEENTVLVYPNPAKDNLTIQSDWAANNKTTVSLFDVAGKELTINYKQQGNTIVLNTSSLIKGVYTLKFRVTNKEISRKFVKID